MRARHQHTASQALKYNFRVCRPKANYFKSITSMYEVDIVEKPARVREDRQCLYNIASAARKLFEFTVGMPVDQIVCGSTGMRAGSKKLFGGDIHDVA